MDEPVVRNDCEAQREGPEPRCNQEEPLHELGYAPSGGRTSRTRSVSETAKTPSLIPSVRSVRYLRPVLSLSSFDEPSPLMTFSRQLPFDPAVGAGQRIAFALPG